ncbi:tRNA 2-selenouridine(34) synthase MnmH [Desulfotalea psychrophila]|uniref:Rhodanese domain-containing protein n=1 Tax=Desulfotalea psychrophila (strain LSv54 / DSM 12343) TaxID=177439 RepID=Q6AQE7_DESPS|nr:tRNA 2-selenouridine(34) synthase MnmH [Desulfotalea psychrophila]CAG35426.1 conserved hypothetical protein [Desulfotalea psychrophila LSv54]
MKKEKEGQAIDPETMLAEALHSVAFTDPSYGDYLVVDVRTHAEFIENSLPGAINIPLFDEMERSVIGTLYKQVGRQEAVQAGFEIVHPKLSAIVESFEPYRQRKLLISCARGGMRSRAVVNLLAGQGFNIAQLEGGYKAYRHTVLDRVKNFAPEMIVLHGMTGVGKTRIIEKLSPSIDLELMANHRSSLFGALDREASNQKGFEAAFYQKIEEGGQEPFFVEGESRKIGQVFMPDRFAVAMKQARMVFVTASMETRVQRIIEDYPMDDPQVRSKALAVVKSLRQRLGGKIVDQLSLLLQRDDLSEFVHILLTDYYDGRYGNCMLEYNYDLRLSSENIDDTVAELVKYRQSLL